MNHEVAPWQVLSERLVHDGGRQLRVYEERVRLPDGRELEPYPRIEMPDIVIVAAETADGRLILERQYKHGPRRISYTIPAGQIETGEDPLEAAKRELLEETGHQAREWLKLGAFCMGSNAGVGTANVFLASGCRQVRAPDSGDYEAMEIVLMTRDEAVQTFQAGDIVLMGSALALGLYFAAALHPSRTMPREEREQ